MSVAEAEWHEAVTLFVVTPQRFFSNRNLKLVLNKYYSSTEYPLDASFFHKDLKRKGFFHMKVTFREQVLELIDFVHENHSFHLSSSIIQEGPSLLPTCGVLTENLLAKILQMFSYLFHIWMQFI
jgi:hypothetical protein